MFSLFSVKKAFRNYSYKFLIIIIKRLFLGILSLHFRDLFYFFVRELLYYNLRHVCVVVRVDIFDSFSSGYPCCDYYDVGFRRVALNISVKF